MADEIGEIEAGAVQMIITYFPGVGNGGGRIELSGPVKNEMLAFYLLKKAEQLVQLQNQPQILHQGNTGAPMQVPIDLARKLRG